MKMLYFEVYTSLKRFPRAIDFPALFQYKFGNIYLH